MSGPHQSPGAVGSFHSPDVHHGTSSFPACATATTQSHPSNPSPCLLLSPRGTADQRCILDVFCISQLLFGICLAEIQWRISFSASFCLFLGMAGTWEDLVSFPSCVTIGLSPFTLSLLRLFLLLVHYYKHFLTLLNFESHKMPTTCFPPFLIL